MLRGGQQTGHAVITRVLNPLPPRRLSRGESRGGSLVAVALREVGEVLRLRCHNS